MGQTISYIEASGFLEQELRIEKPFSLPNAEHDNDVLQRIVCLVQGDWLANQVISKGNVVPHRRSGKSLSAEEKTTLLQPSHESEWNGWRRIDVIVIKKPLRKLKRTNPGSADFENSSLSDILCGIVKEDHEYMRKIINERFHKKHEDQNEQVDYLSEDLFKDLIGEIYDINVKKLASDPLSSTNNKTQTYTANKEAKSCTTVLHLAPVILAMESDTCFYIFEDTPQHTLYDVLAFSPAIVANSAAKFLFITYQILQCFSTFRSRGFNLSPSLTFKDLFISNSMWISVSGFHLKTSDVKLEEKAPVQPLIEKWLSKTPEFITAPFRCTNTLQYYTTMWINCELTNFDYIMILNTLSNRRMKDPSHYPIFPWVIDFTKQNGGFRDLTKSKYRLCKSDAQLDITFKNLPTKQSRRDAITHTPHHISDHPLTIISYYVYLARKTPKDVLCKNVRTRWVPDEYPSSMERLFEWTPEECIPEFYSDASIFKSIHSDLPDLLLPSWASSPEDFITQHRNILEGSYVSMNLNHWIDLVFGYKLFGTASVEAKNVYLSVVDGHSYVTNCGVLQLFSRPHPSRNIENWSKSHSEKSDANGDPEGGFKHFYEDLFADNPFSDDVACVDGRLLEDDVNVKQPLALRRDLWSVESAIDVAGEVEENDESDAPSKVSFPAVIKHRLDSLLEGTASEAKNPVLEEIRMNFSGPLTFIEDLERVEKQLKFEVQLAPPNESGVGEHEFGSVFDSFGKNNKEGRMKAQESASISNTDIQLLCNLLIELVLHDQSRLRTFRLDLQERTEENMRQLKSNLYRFPSWLVVVLDSLFDTSEQNRLTRNEGDLEMTKYMKTPSMFLNPNINPFSLPSYFPAMHEVLATLFATESPRMHSPTPMNKSVSFSTCLNGCISSDSILRASQLLPSLLEDLDSEGIDLLLTFVLPLFSNQDTKLSAFLYMFQSLGAVLGFQKSLAAFYNDLQKIYDHCNKYETEDYKLYDQGFISKVITVFGLSFFLDRFMPFVVEELVEQVENYPFKEKSESGSLDQHPGKITDDADDAIENEFLRGDKASSQSAFPADFDKESPNTNKNRENFESFLEEDDESGVNLFDPSALAGRKLVRSGVFTRLESILEDEKTVGIVNFSEISEEDESALEDDSRTGWKLGQEVMNNEFLNKELVEAREAQEDLVGLKASTSSNDDSEASRICNHQDSNDTASSLHSDPKETGNCHNDAKTSIHANNETEVGNILTWKHGNNFSDINTGQPDDVPPLNSKDPKRGQDSSVVEAIRTSELSNEDVDIADGKGFVGKVKERLSKVVGDAKAVKSSLPLLSKLDLSSSRDVDDVTDPLSRFSNTEGNVSGELNDSNRGQTNSEDTEFEEEHSMYSIDSMTTDDDCKSFLVRRSALKSKRKGDQSPFMILHSDDEIGSHERSEDESPEEIIDIALDKIPETDSLEEIEKIPSSSSSKSLEQDMCAQDLSLSSLRWIVPWLGPVLTTRHVVNAVLKKLPRVWLNVRNSELTNDALVETLASRRRHLIECVIDVVEVYGNAFVVHQFIPYAVQAVEVAVSAQTVSALAEGKLVTSTEILLKTLALLKSEVLFGQIETLSQQVFEPLLRLLSSLKRFSSGAQVRSFLLKCLVDLMASLSKSLGQIDAREVMTPLLQRFFSCFDCIYRLDKKQGNSNIVFRKYSFMDEYCDDDISTGGDIDIDDASDGDISQRIGDKEEVYGNNSISDNLDRSVGACTGDSAVDNANEDISSYLTAVINESVSNVQNDSENRSNLDTQLDDKNCAFREEITKEQDNLYKDLYDSFKPSLAYYSYVLFCRVLGDHFMGSILYNEDLIWQLCSNYDEGLTLTSTNDVFMSQEATKTALALQGTAKDADVEDSDRGSPDKRQKRHRTISEHEEVERPARSTWQHVEGEWLQHWKDNFESRNEEGKFFFNGRRLQTYAGHLSSVRDVYVPDNEHYFLSASRDKTVKLWLLKNHGNGTAHLSCSKTYDNHTKSVFAIQAVESKRLVASCDGSVHLWDPMNSSLVSQVDPGKNSSFLSIRTLPVPHSTVAMATTESTIKMYDVRQKVMCQEWKLVSSSAAGTVKCLCVNESGVWIAAGFSSGFISVLDLRTGILRGQWRAHESEVLQIAPYSEHNFLSSSADLRLKMWNEDGSLALRFRSPPEPIPYLSLCKDQCIWATATGNKIGITHTVENWANYSSKKLPQDLFKGNVSSLTVLPVNQTYLVGSENGNVTLFA